MFSTITRRMKSGFWIVVVEGELDQPGQRLEGRLVRPGRPSPRRSGCAGTAPRARRVQALLAAVVVVDHPLATCACARRSRRCGRRSGPFRQIRASRPRGCPPWSARDRWRVPGPVRIGFVDRHLTPLFFWRGTHALPSKFPRRRVITSKRASRQGLAIDGIVRTISRTWPTTDGPSGRLPDRVTCAWPQLARRGSWPDMAATEPVLAEGKTSRMNRGSLRRYGAYIGGAERAPAGGEYFPTDDPFSGEAWALVARCGPMTSTPPSPPPSAFEAWSRSAPEPATERCCATSPISSSPNADRLAEIEQRDNGKLAAEVNAPGPLCGRLFPLLRRSRRQGRRARSSRPTRRASSPTPSTSRRAWSRSSRRGTRR